MSKSTSVPEAKPSHAGSVPQAPRQGQPLEPARYDGNRYTAEWDGFGEELALSSTKATTFAAA